ncbi:MAG: class I SAM-dependent methyltransferase [Anaerolineae bacterium]|nr:class I SAM-dependent methyltransferase [Anaerolineae bacterium]
METSLRFSNWAFDLQYILDRTPWDTQVTPPEVVELVEGGNIPAGRALDLGCGTGTNCIYLARHGWQAVGVDFSTLAIWRGRCKARRAGIDCTFYRADVTDLSFLEETFDFVLDIGCLHGVPVEGWQRYAAQVSRLVRPEGLYMLYAFVPRPDRLGPRGVSPAELRDLFERAFVVERQEGGDDPTGPSAAWYWMRRTGAGG